MYTVDYSRNDVHETAIRIAEKNLRPFTRFFVIGRPVTFNADFLPKKTNNSLDITNLIRYIEYMAELKRWQEGLRTRPKFEKRLL